MQHFWSHFLSTGLSRNFREESDRPKSDIYEQIVNITSKWLIPEFGKKVDSATYIYRSR